MELKTYRIQYRIWHWANAFTIIGLLATVFLRKTFMSYKSNALIIQNELSKISIDITEDAAKIIGKAIRSPMWDWHYVLGFILAGLFLYRIVLHFTDRSFIPAAEIKQKQGKYKIVEYMYIIQYLLVLLMVMSGLLMYFKDALSLSKGLVETIKECHEIIMFFFAVYVPMHIVGVFVAENQDQKGIVSNIIGGKAK